MIRGIKTRGNKMLKKFETGRSMIEMLGVLAIIGVLSVGGIAGYTTAMRSHRANEIINGASMLYMMGMSQNAGEGNGILQFTTSIGAVPSGANQITYDSGQIAISFTDLSVCQQVKNKLGDKVTIDGCDRQIPSIVVTMDNIKPAIEPTIEDGNDCTNDAECISGKCGSMGQCLLSDGEDCGQGMALPDDALCASGYCNDQMRCQSEPLKPLGGICTQNWQCLSGRCCSNTCIQYKLAGESCTENCECPVGNECIAGQCQTPNSKSGIESCTENRECQSNICSSSTHKCLGILNGTCDMGTGCIEGTCGEVMFDIYQCMYM